MVFRPDEHDVQDFNHTNPVDPVEYLVEIIGEAAARVGTESREKYPSIPWLQVVGIRNRLVHGYDAVDLDVLWDTIIDDLPRLSSAPGCQLRHFSPQPC